MQCYGMFCGFNLDGFGCRFCVFTLDKVRSCLRSYLGQNFVYITTHIVLGHAIAWASKLQSWVRNYVGFGANA